MKNALTLILITISFSTFAQRLPSLRFEKLSADDGLTSNNCKTIFQDKNGYIWIGTNGGTSKYNGYTFENYKTVEDDPYSASSNAYNDIKEDNKGNLWIACVGSGLDFYDIKTGRFYNFRRDPNNPKSLQLNNPTNVAIDGRNRIWVSGQGKIYIGSLDRFYSKNTLDFEVFDYLENNNNKSRETNCLHRDNKGNIWISASSSIAMVNTKNNEVQIIKGSTYGFQTWNNSTWFFTGKTLNEAYYSANGTLFFRKYNMQPQRWKNKNYNLSAINAFTFDRRNTLWIAANKNGGLFTAKIDSINNTYLLKSHSVHIKSNPGSLSDNTIRKNGIIVDKTNNVWIATNTRGICKYNAEQKLFKHIKQGEEEGDISFERVRTIKEDGNNNLWFGTNMNKELAIIKRTDRNGEYNHFKCSNRDNNIFYGIIPQSPVNTIASITTEKYSRIYFYNSGRKIIYASVAEDSDSLEFLSYHHKNLPGNGNMHILADEDNTLWLSFYNGGLGHVMLDENGDVDTFYVYRHDENNASSIPDNLVRYTYQTNDGTLWVGTGGGLSRIQRNSKDDHKLIFENFFQEKDNENSLSNNYIITILETEDGTLWIGTHGGGLNKMILDENNTPIFTSYSVKNGLPDNTIKSIVEDNNNDLWLSTSNGLCHFNRKDQTFINYNKDDGLQANDFLDNSFEKLESGEILFGGVNGITAFFPDSIKNNPYAANARLSYLKINNEIVSIGTKYKKGIILNELINNIDKIKLSYKERIIEIGFSTDHYGNSKNNKFRYKLEPNDKEWVYTDANRRFATYSNLKGGKYILTVQAANSDGLWGEPKSLAIRMFPPWWKTSFFTIVWIIAIIYLSFYFIKRREKAAKENKAYLEQKVTEGKKLISEKIKEVEQQQAEIKKRDEQEKEIRFTNKGIVEFSKILSKENNNLKNLAQETISTLINYVEAQMGAIFIWPEFDESDSYVKLFGSFSYNNLLLNEDDKIIHGEGNVGTCFKTGETIILNNVSNDYLRLSSGLGEIKPKYLYILAIKQGNNIQGVIEIASITPLEKFKIDFIEKICENINSAITIHKSQLRMQELLDESKYQANELKSQEEEVRQNMEEMMATQEEMSRKIEEMTHLDAEIKRLKMENRELANELSSYK